MHCFFLPLKSSYSCPPFLNFAVGPRKNASSINLLHGIFSVNGGGGVLSLDPLEVKDGFSCSESKVVVVVSLED